ncbi:MAG: L-threonylcarbamoyladenylate synthase, partial [Coriobacteriia bacterium]
MNKVIHVDPENPSAEVVNLAATMLKDGGIVVFPTETVYGIGASATSCIGSQEIIDIKMRPKNKPLPWLVDGEGALDTYGVDVPEYAHRLALAFWPGALTIVVKAAEVVAKEFRDEHDAVALRSPDHRLVQELIRVNGAAIVTTSANTSGLPPATSFDELEERIIAAADIALDGGETPHKLASTVVLCTGPEPVVARVGP